MLVPTMLFFRFLFAEPEYMYSLPDPGIELTISRWQLHWSVVSIIMFITLKDENDRQNKSNKSKYIDISSLSKLIKISKNRTRHRVMVNKLIFFV